MADFDWASEGGLAALGQGVKGFAQGWMDAEDRQNKKLEMEAKTKAAESEKERHRFMDGLTARDKGFQATPGADIYKQDPATMQRDPEWLKLQEQKAAADPLGLKAAQLQNAKLESVKKQQDIAQGALEAKKSKLSPIQGYQKTENYVATPIEEKALREGQAQIGRFNNVMDGLKAKVAAASQADLANPLSDTSKAIKNDLRDLQLIYKGDAFAQLGVLTGPDLKILEDIIENPGSFSNLVSGKEGVVSRYDQARDRVNTGFQNKVTTLGLVPMRADAKMPGKLATGKLATGKLESPTPVQDEAAKLKRLAELRAKAAGGQ